MSEEEYVVRTKNGSFYPVVVKRGLLGKTQMVITLGNREHPVNAISEKNDPVDIARSNPAATIDEGNLKPGKIIYFAEGRSLGNTSRIEKVYRKVA